MLLCSFVLPSRGKAAADVALGLVLLQKCLDLQPQRAVALGQTLADVLMYSGFADAELLCGGAHRRVIFDEIQGQHLRALFQILLDRAPLLLAVSLYAGEKAAMRKFFHICGNISCVAAV